MARCPRIEFSDSAVEDLEAILRWYASQDVPHVGDEMVTSLVERIDQLAAFPDSGRIVPEFDTDWLRELVVPPYRVVYRREHDAVVVVRVWRSERLMDTEPGGDTQPADGADNTPRAR